MKPPEKKKRVAPAKATKPRQSTAPTGSGRKSGTGTPDRFGIYVASKAVAHGQRWKELRDQGEPIISTWIDESDPGATLDWTDLWARCLHEAMTAEVLIAYMEPGEVLKGAWIEIGAALAAGVPVIGVGIEDFSIAKSGKIRLAGSMEAALEMAKAVMAERRGAAKPLMEAGDQNPEMQMRSLRLQNGHLRQIAIDYRKRAETAEAEIADCSSYLKPGETPRQRMDRDHRDILGLMNLLAREKQKTAAHNTGSETVLRKTSSEMKATDGATDLDPEQDAPSLPLMP